MWITSGLPTVWELELVGLHYVRDDLSATVPAG
jgi:hypothetical protein